MEEMPLMTSTLTQEEIVKILEEVRREEPTDEEVFGAIQTVEEGTEEGMELDPSLIETIMKSLIIESNTNELFSREEHRVKSFVD